MTEIILAGALGVIAPVVFLLSHRLRQLSWQLTQLRVERDSERILRDIGLRAGTGSPDPPESEAARAIRHERLAPHHGGSLGAALAELCHNHRPAVVAAAATAVAAAAFLVLG
ncbi:hypothetical protein ACFVP3_23260 [Streptomyces sp. NPDC057806]|uniref:hypothetical protein n=1 Tax=Streptomyces sp. NPDC057806 TaxID=3346255 RepID=UPI0036C5A585